MAKNTFIIVTALLVLCSQYILWYFGYFEGLAIANRANAFCRGCGKLTLWQLHNVTLSLLVLVTKYKHSYNNNGRTSVPGYFVPEFKLPANTLNPYLDSRKVMRDGAGT